MIKLAIVSPCYNEEEVLESSISKLTVLFDRLVGLGKISPDSFFMFVNDGSCDKTWNIILRYHKENPYVKGINLAKNVGHQKAIMAGMMTAKDYAEAVITIDADLQDDINAIPQMISEFEKGNEIVYGVKVSRKADPLMKRLSAVTFYKLQSLMGVDTVFNHADFRLMSKRALEFLSGYEERNLYLRGLIPQIGLQTTTVDDAIGEREAGRSKYNLHKMLGLALDGITSFSVKPIYGIIYMGLLFVTIGILIGVYVLYSIYQGTAVQGWASLILSIWTTGGFMMIAIGVVGVYIGRIYSEVKHRPRYNIKDILK